MIYTPIIWPILISALIQGGIALYARRYYAAPAARMFNITAWLAFAWLLGYIPNFSTYNPSWKFLWVQLQMIPAIFIAPSVLAFALEYTGKGDWLTRKNLGGMLFIPALSVLGLLTSPYHNLFRYNFRLEPASPFPIFLSDKGTLYWIYLAYTIALVLLSFALLLTSFNTRTLLFRNTLLITAGFFAPFAVNLLYLLGVTPLRGLDLTPFAFILAGLIYIVAMRDFRIFEVNPIARQAVMDNLADLVLVLDMRGNIADYNRAAQAACGLSPAQIGSSPQTLSQPWADLCQRHAETLSCKEEISLALGGSPRIFDLTISPIQDKQNRNLGRLFLLREITERKKTEDALLASEKRYRELADEAPLAVAVVDLATGKVAYANRRASDLFEIPTDQTLGILARDRYANPEDRDRLLRLLKEQGQATEFEAPMITGKGRKFWASITSNISMFEGRPAIHSTYSDITEKKHVEEALQDSEKRYRLLAENISDVIWILDLETSKFRYVSPSVERLRGYTVEEVMAQDMSAALTPDSFRKLQEAVPAKLEKFLRGKQHGKYYVDQLAQPCKNGSTVWTETTTRFIQNPDSGHIEVYGVSRDITARKQAEDQLRQSELTARTLLELPTAAILLVALDETFLDCNETLSQWMRIPRQELLGRPALDFLPPEIAQLRRRYFIQSIQSGQMVRWEDHNNNRYFDNIFAPIKDRDGKIISVIGCGYDITELKQAQLQERELAALEERQRLARDLHDAVSQTLFSARLTSEMLLRQKDSLTPEALWANIRHFTRLVVSALGEMRILLLELRPEGLANTELPILLSHLADATTSRTDAEIRQAMHVKKALPVDVKIAFYRIAQEAINNIVKHSRATEIGITLSGENDGITLTIQDNGRGFDIKNLAGHQLGVNIMRERADEVGARLEIASQPGNGTRITCAWQGEGNT